MEKQPFAASICRALAGVWDHSSFRDDLGARLGRTAFFIAATTFGGRDMAEQAMEPEEDEVGVVVTYMPQRPNPVTQSEMDAGSIELF